MYFYRDTRHVDRSRIRSPFLIGKNAFDVLSAEEYTDGIDTGGAAAHAFKPRSA
jgi:hypothetical protein